MLRFAIYSLTGLIVSGLVVVTALFLATAGDNRVAATVVDDPNLAAFEINGIRLHGEHSGARGAPVIIALHGGPGGDYAGLLPLRALEDRFQVVFYDQRGAGLSERVPADALSLDQYLQELDTIAARFSPDAPVILIGHSWGAMLASAYLAAYPDRVDRAVLMEPGYLNSADFAVWQAQADQIMSGFNFLRSSVWNGFRAAHVDGPDAAASRDFLIGEMVRGFADHADNPYTCPDKSWAQPAWRFGALASDTARNMPAFELNRLVAEPVATAPVLLIAGACNSWIGQDLQRRNLAYFANATVRVIPDAGHAMLTDNPTATLAEIRAFLDE